MSEIEPVGSNEFIARVAARSYIVLGICFGSPAVVSVALTVVMPKAIYDWWPVLVFGIATTSLVFVWLRGFSLRIHEGTLLYKTLFTREHKVLLNDISVVKYILDFNPWRYPRKPANRLEIYTGSGSSHKTLQFCINVKVFRTQDIQYLMRLLKSKRK